MDSLGGKLEVTTFCAAIIFNGLPDLKKSGVQALATSDSQRLLLKRSSISLQSSEDQDLHSDEKNEMVRKFSGSGLKLWVK